MKLTSSQKSLRVSEKQPKSDLSPREISHSPLPKILVLKQKPNNYEPIKKTTKSQIVQGYDSDKSISISKNITARISSNSTQILRKKVISSHEKSSGSASIKETEKIHPSPNLKNNISKAVSSDEHKYMSKDTKSKLEPLQKGTGLGIKIMSTVSGNIGNSRTTSLKQGKDISTTVNNIFRNEASETEEVKRTNKYRLDPKIRPNATNSKKFVSNRSNQPKTPDNLTLTDQAQNYKNLYKLNKKDYGTKLYSSTTQTNKTFTNQSSSTRPKSNAALRTHSSVFDINKNKGSHEKTIPSGYSTDRRSPADRKSSPADRGTTYKLNPQNKTTNSGTLTSTKYVPISGRLLELSKSRPRHLAETKKKIQEISKQAELKPLSIYAPQKKTSTPKLNNIKISKDRNYKKFDTNDLSLSKRTYLRTPISDYDSSNTSKFEDFPKNVDSPPKINLNPQTQNSILEDSSLVTHTPSNPEVLSSEGSYKEFSSPQNILNKPKNFQDSENLEMVSKNIEYQSIFDQSDQMYNSMYENTDVDKFSIHEIDKSESQKSNLTVQPTININKDKKNGNNDLKSERNSLNDYKDNEYTKKYSPNKTTSNYLALNQTQNQENLENNPQSMKPGSLNSPRLVSEFILDTQLTHNSLMDILDSDKAKTNIQDTETTETNHRKFFDTNIDHTLNNNMFDIKYQNSTENPLESKNHENKNITLSEDSKSIIESIETFSELYNESKNNYSVKNKENQDLVLPGKKMSIYEKHKYFSSLNVNFPLIPETEHENEQPFRVSKSSSILNGKNNRINQFKHPSSISLANDSIASSFEKRKPNLFIKSEMKPPSLSLSKEHKYLNKLRTDLVLNKSVPNFLERKAESIFDTNLKIGRSVSDDPPTKSSPEISSSLSKPSHLFKKSIIDLNFETEFESHIDKKLQSLENEILDSDSFRRDNYFNQDQITIKENVTSALRLEQILEHCSENIKNGSRNSVLKEIADSELVYLSDMYVLRDIFYSPSSSSDATNITKGFNEKDKDIIFGNLKDIIELTEHLVLEMSKVIEDEFLENLSFVTLADVFCNFSDSIEETYSVYCSQFENALSRISEITTEVNLGNLKSEGSVLFDKRQVLVSKTPKLKKSKSKTNQNSTFSLNLSKPKSLEDTLYSNSISEFLDEQQKLLVGKTGSWDLRSLLIKPVQRILKYHLLLSRLADLTENKFKDIYSQAAYRYVLVAENVNKANKPENSNGESSPTIIRNNTFSRLNTTSNISISKKKKSVSYVQPTVKLSDEDKKLFELNDKFNLWIDNLGIVLEKIHQWEDSFRSFAFQINIQSNFLLEFFYSNINSEYSSEKNDGFSSTDESFFLKDVKSLSTISNGPSVFDPRFNENWYNSNFKDIQKYANTSAEIFGSLFTKLVHQQLKKKVYIPLLQLIKVAQPVRKLSTRVTEVLYSNSNGDFHVNESFSSSLLSFLDAKKALISDIPKLICLQQEALGMIIFSINLIKKDFYSKATQLLSQEFEIPTVNNNLSTQLNGIENGKIHPVTFNIKPLENLWTQPILNQFIDNSSVPGDKRYIGITNNYLCGSESPNFYEIGYESELVHTSTFPSSQDCFSYLEDISSIFSGVKLFPFSDFCEPQFSERSKKLLNEKSKIPSFLKRPAAFASKLSRVANILSNGGKSSSSNIKLPPQSTNSYTTNRNSTFTFVQNDDEGFKSVSRKELSSSKFPSRSNSQSHTLGFSFIDSFTDGSNNVSELPVLDLAELSLWAIGESPRQDVDNQSIGGNHYLNGEVNSFPRPYNSRKTNHISSIDDFSSTESIDGGHLVHIVKNKDEYTNLESSTNRRKSSFAMVAPKVGRSTSASFDKRSTYMSSSGFSFLQKKKSDIFGSKIKRIKKHGRGPSMISMSSIGETESMSNYQVIDPPSPPYFEMSQERTSKLVRISRQLSEFSVSTGGMPQSTLPLPLSTTMNDSSIKHR
ncbi:hypothetical protein BB559_002311 [Furculomyces boomerangus]|uniref:DH domain-containing protein n=1 Tax=Furculomyces boomerangus TaxID=61424 RepID=A0A2T9YWB2_9FUNG|nr:hypothetical protein BB559_002311 [Furculomyces boomerangus]